jgi:type IV secretory pathway VirD2 relaxase
MARDDSDEFQIRPGPVSHGGATGRRRHQSFVSQVMIAVRKAGGDPSMIARTGQSGGSRTRNTRFNARGRGAKVMASLPKDGGEWQLDSAGRFRSRRVVVKARVIRLNGQRGSRDVKMQNVTGRSIDAHLNYLERDGVTRDGERGKVYSSLHDQADGKAFINRGRSDRHQFRLVVAPEDSAELQDLRGFTRELMQKLEIDLETTLDWIAIDHHNTGHPHTHILVRGVTDEGHTLNIAGDYIAYGIRHRARELVTIELGHQSELEAQVRLRRDVDAERVTRLDKALLAEQRDHGVVDLRLGEGANALVRENRVLMVGRVRRLQRYGLAKEIKPGQWVLAGKTEVILRDLDEQNNIIKTTHRALAAHGLAETRDVSGYVRHRRGIDRTVTGHVLAKGLAGDEMDERVYLVLDGIDGRVHHFEFADPSMIEDVRVGMIVEAGPPIASSISADRNIANVAKEDRGLYRPSRYMASISEGVARQGKDPAEIVAFHVRRLEALSRAGHVQRIAADAWWVPDDVVERGRSYDLTQRSDRLGLRILSSLDLERQIASDGATWLDRELVVRDAWAITETGFGRQVREALDRRAQRLVEMGLATAKDGRVIVPGRAIATLEQHEIRRAGQAMALARGQSFQPVKPGDKVRGTLVGSTDLSSGRFAILEMSGATEGFGFTLVPWQPQLDQRIGQRISGVMRETGGVDWQLGRKRGLEL